MGLVVTLDLLEGELLGFLVTPDAVVFPLPLPGGFQEVHRLFPFLEVGVCQEGPLLLQDGNLPLEG